MSYTIFDFGKAMIITGFGLLVLWIILSVKRRSVRIGAFIAGLLIAFCFFTAANTKNIGWYEVGFYLDTHFDRGGGEVVALNPFLHLQTDADIASDYFRNPLQYTYHNSLLPFNMLIYFVYGEAISFSLLFLFTMLRRIFLKHRLASDTASMKKKLRNS
jgi:hypothetical protein